MKLLNSIGTDLLKSAAASLSTRAGAMVLNLLFNLLVARTLGVAASGLLFTGLALATIAAVPSRIGLDTSLVRLGSPLWRQNDRVALFALWQRALGLTLGCSVLAGGLFFAAAPFIAGRLFASAELVGPLQTIALSTLPLALVSVAAGGMKMLGRPALASGYEAGTVPLGFMVIAGATLAAGQPLDMQACASAFSGAASIASLAGLLTLRRAIPAGQDQVPAPSLAGESLPVLGVDLMNVILAVGLLPVVALVAGAHESGVFNAAMRLTAPLGVVLLVLNNVFSARLANALETGHRDETARLCRSYRIVGLVVVIPLAATLVWLEQIPQLLFGPGFGVASTMIPILCIGHAAAIATGPMGLVLIHAGRARQLRGIMLLTVFISLPLTAMLALLDGGRGAAVGVAVSLVLPRWLALRAGSSQACDATGNASCRSSGIGQRRPQTVLS